MIWKDRGFRQWGAGGWNEGRVAAGRAGTAGEGTGPGLEGRVSEGRRQVLSCENPEMAKTSGSCFCQHRAEYGNGVWEPGDRISLSPLSACEKRPTTDADPVGWIFVQNYPGTNNLEKERCVQDGKAFLAMSPKVETTKCK